MNVHARTRRIVLILVLLALFLLPLSPSLASSPNLRTISIVSTNDIHGALVGAYQSFSPDDLVGGMDWDAGYINLVREENPGGVLYLDAGDLMQGTLESGYCKGASMIEAMNAMGVAAMAVGNHEFDWGQDVLQERIGEANFPFLAANIFYAAKTNGNPDHGHGKRPDWLEPYIITEVNGVQVGIIGIANPETPELVNPVLIDDLVFTDPVEAVNDVLPEVEKKGADLVVVLAHIGGFYDSQLHAVTGEIVDLANGLNPNKVDLIVSGHTHSRLDDVIHGIPVVQAYSSGTAFARVDFVVNAKSGHVVSYEMNYSATTTYHTRTVTYGEGEDQYKVQYPATYTGFDGVRRTVVPDPDVADIVAKHVAAVEDIKSEVIGETTKPITCNYRHESAMGDWTTDIMRAYTWGDTPIDFAFTNSGGFRTDIDLGPITFGELYQVMPFDNTLVVVELTGAEVIAALEQGISGEHGLIQVSGLQFSFDYGKTAGSRITSPVIDLNTGEPLVDTDTYYVATNDFMATGGDGYTVLAENPQENTFVLVRDMLVDWCKAQTSAFTPPDPGTEQRISDTGTAPV